ncbi:MAG: LPS assembly lipoprotein LptE [Methylophilaceae bacterium]|nr:LPS assembly lipoprotein LptE [Methylophilaceae bacterium]
MILQRLSRIAILAAALALTACGFEMRGTADLAFKTLYMEGANLTVKKDLIKSLKINGVSVVDDSQKADLFLDLLSEQREQNILSLSGGGVVREFELVYRVNFRLRNPESETWSAVQTIEGRRDFSYDDTQLLAKQFEEQRLFEDLRNDAVREIMRLLVVQKPKNL